MVSKEPAEDCVQKAFVMGYLSLQISEKRLPIHSCYATATGGGDSLAAGSGCWAGLHYCWCQERTGAGKIQLHPAILLNVHDNYVTLAESASAYSEVCGCSLMRMQQIQFQRPHSAPSWYHGDQFIVVEKNLWLRKRLTAITKNAIRTSLLFVSKLLCRVCTSCRY